MFLKNWRKKTHYKQHPFSHDSKSGFCIICNALQTTVVQITNAIKGNINFPISFQTAVHCFANTPQFFLESKFTAEELSCLVWMPEWSQWKPKLCQQWTICTWYMAYCWPRMQWHWDEWLWANKVSWIMGICWICIALWIYLLLTCCKRKSVPDTTSTTSKEQQNMIYNYSSRAMPLFNKCKGAYRPVKILKMTVGLY